MQDHEKSEQLQQQVQDYKAWFNAGEQRIRTLMQLIPEGLLITNQSGKIEACNPRCLSLFACNYSDLIDKSYSMLFEPIASGKDGADKLAENSPALLLRALRCDGSDFPARVQVMTFSSVDEKQLLVFVEDLSKEYELEQIKREFTAMLTHDIRTPLSTVVGLLSMLEEGVLGQLSERGRSVAGRSRYAIRQILLLLDDLLDLEKIQSGKFLLERKSVSMKELMYKAVEIVSFPAEEQGLTFSVDGPDLICFADDHRIIQVLVNLCANAIKYSPDESTIRLVSEDCREFVKVSVIDQGRGIPAEKMDKVFSRYEQVEIADSKEKHGTGLGLAVCEAIVKEHGGEIGVESTPGKGSSFWFKIPKQETLVRD